MFQIYTTETRIVVSCYIIDSLHFVVSFMQDAR